MLNNNKNLSIPILFYFLIYFFESFKKKLAFLL